MIITGSSTQQISPVVAVLILILVLLIVVGLGYYFSQSKAVPPVPVELPASRPSDAPARTQPVSPSAPAHSPAPGR